MFTMKLAEPFTKLSSSVAIWDSNIITATDALCYLSGKFAVPRLLPALTIYTVSG